MEYDHINPKGQEANRFSYGRDGYAWKTILAEIKKCELFVPIVIDEGSLIASTRIQFLVEESTSNGIQRQSATKEHRQEGQTKETR